MALYTRTGDKGETSILQGRVSKADLKIEVIGTIDEANSFIGLAIAHLPQGEAKLKGELTRIQHHLFDCGTDLSMKEAESGHLVNREMVLFLEKAIDNLQEEAPDLSCFILPGGTPAASFLHVARTVVRRAERLTVALAQKEKINPWVLPYLNRLSDYLFASARVVNHRAGYKDVPYIKGYDQTNKKEEKGAVHMKKLTFYHYPQCTSCKKAKEWLTKEGYALDPIHIVDHPPDKETLRRLWKQSGEKLSKFFNVRGSMYKELNLKEKLPQMDEEEQLELLASHGKLIRRPIVTDGEKVTVGFDPKTFAENWTK